MFSIQPPNSRHSWLRIRPFDQDASLRVPDPYALVETTGSDVAVVGRDGDGGDAIFDLECKDTLVFLNVPETDSPVAGAGGDVTAVGGEI